MKKAIYALILPLVVVSGLLFANHGIKNETKPSPKPLSIADRKAGLEDRKKWEASPQGNKVRASGEKIMKHIKNYADIEAVVTSFSLPSRARGGGTSALREVMVSINGEAYILNFGSVRSNENFQQLLSLKVNDKIVVRGHSVGYSPNYPYLIISPDYVERNSKILFNRNISNDVNRNISNDGC